MGCAVALSTSRILPSRRRKCISSLIQEAAARMCRASETTAMSEPEGWEDAWLARLREMRAAPARTNAGPQRIRGQGHERDQASAIRRAASKAVRATHTHPEVVRVSNLQTTESSTPLK